MASGGKTALSEVEEREFLDLGLGEEINLDSDIRGADAPPEVETPREPRVSGFAYTDVREGVISSRNYITVERGEEVEQVPVFRPWRYGDLWRWEVRECRELPPYTPVWRNTVKEPITGT